MKRLLAAVLAVCMISGIVGCGKNQRPGTLQKRVAQQRKKKVQKQRKKKKASKKWSGNLEIRRLKTIRKLYLLDSLVKNLNT